jgi:hypothetical protein
MSAVGTAAGIEGGRNPTKPKTSVNTASRQSDRKFFTNTFMSVPGGKLCPIIPALPCLFQMKPARVATPDHTAPT